MNIKKISIGLLLLMLALVVVPDAMAYPSETQACSVCHITPANGGTLSITNLAAPATVAPSQVFNVDVTWTGGSTSGTTTAKWLTASANNNQFSFNPTQTNNLPSAGTASFAVTAPSSPATYTIGVWTSSGPSPRVTDYKEVVITVNAPAPVLSSVTISPLNQAIIAGNNLQFTATPDVSGATLAWTSSNPSAGTIDSNGLFTSTATNSGTTTITVTATSGAVTVTNSTTLTVNPPVGSHGDDYEEHHEEHVGEHDEVHHEEHVEDHYKVYHRTWSTSHDD